MNPSNDCARPRAKEETGMISRKMLAVFGVAVLAAGLMVSPASATRKKCPKLCKDNLKTCLDAAKAANPCKGLKGEEKKACKTSLKAAIKECKDTIKAAITECKGLADDSVHSICDSPSAAFLD